mmetsp:Transcript_21697/g.71835  ORF Transcript_21697/g.71835 Transcript_21697/m.71835 type:complete len:194 (+) Transcript_21697:1197-1778(+)
MDFSTVVELLSFAVLDALPVQAPVVVTIFPERWTRLTRDCPSSSIEAIADSFLFVADTGPGSIVAIDVGPYLQQQTRVIEGDANVAGFDEQATRPGAATAPRRNRLAYSSPLSLTFVDGATMSSPYALCFAQPWEHATELAKVKLYVTDISPATPAVVFVDAKNIKFNVRDERPTTTTAAGCSSGMRRAPASL